MILDIYGTPVRKEFDKIISKRAQINEIAAKFRHDYEKGLGNGKSYLKEFVPAQLEFEEIEDHFLAKIAEVARSY